MFKTWFQVLNEVRRLEESAMRNDEELRQMTLEQQQQQRHLVKKIMWHNWNHKIGFANLCGFFKNLSVNYCKNYVRGSGQMFLGVASTRGYHAVVTPKNIWTFPVVSLLWLNKYALKQYLLHFEQRMQISINPRIFNNVCRKYSPTKNYDFKNVVISAFQDQLMQMSPTECDDVEIRTEISQLKQRLAGTDSELQRTNHTLR